MEQFRRLLATAVWPVPFDSSLNGVLAAALLPAIACAAPRLIDPGAGEWYFAEATCVSSDGSVVGGRAARPFRWTEETGRITLGTLNGEIGGAAIDISPDGTWIVGAQYRELIGQVPLRWGLSGWPQRLDYGQTAYTWSSANGVSNQGRVIVGEYLTGPSTREAFIWTQSGGIQLLGTLPGQTVSEANAVSDDGTVVAGASGTAFIWTATTGMIDLGSIPGFWQSSVSALSADGRIAVGYAYAGSSSSTALMWRDGVLQPPLVDLPGVTDSFATGTNRDGTVVVGYYNFWTTPRAFLWTQRDGAVDLTEFIESIGIDLAGERLAFAHDISGDGSTIVGRYSQGNQFRAFILRDLPLGDNRCPACAADFDEDGGVTGGDLAAFMTAYETGARCADVDDDDQIDAKDVAAFLGRFEHGGCE